MPRYGRSWSLSAYSWSDKKNSLRLPVFATILVFVCSPDPTFFGHYHRRSSLVALSPVSLVDLPQVTCGFLVSDVFGSVVILSLLSVSLGRFSRELNGFVKTPLIACLHLRSRPTGWILFWSLYRIHRRTCLWWLVLKHPVYSPVERMEWRQTIVEWIAYGSVVSSDFIAF